MLLACLLAVLATGSQDPAHEPTIPERLDALIAKTNAYEHFTARYRNRAKDGVEGELRFVYRGPDRARMAIDLGGGFADFLVRGTTIEMHSRGEEMPVRVATIRNANAESADFAFVRENLARAFPVKSERAAQPPERPFCFAFALIKDCASLDFSLGTGGPALFRWLQDLRSHLQQVSWAGASHELLEYVPCGEVHVLISAESGLLQRVERHTKDGPLVLLELLESNLTAVAEDGEFTPIPREADAQDDSAEVEADFARRGFQRGRAALFLGLVWRLDEGALEWNDGSGERAGEILRALLLRDVEAIYRPLTDTVSAWIEKDGERISNQLDQHGAQDPDALAQVREIIEKAPEELKRMLLEAADSLCEPPFPSGRCKARPALAAELTAIEKRILSEVFAEKVIAPLLARYVEKLEKLLEAK